VVRLQVFLLALSLLPLLAAVVAVGIRTPLGNRVFVLAAVAAVAPVRLGKRYSLPQLSLA
jgi:hypothetical protein